MWNNICSKASSGSIFLSLPLNSTPGPMGQVGGNSLKTSKDEIDSKNETDSAHHLLALSLRGLMCVVFFSGLVAS